MICKIVYLDKDFDGIVRSLSLNNKNYPLVKVPFSSVGDEVDILSVEEKSIAVAKSYEIIKSCAKNQAECKYFSICGGCKAQHISKEDYITIKKQNVVNAFAYQNIDLQEYFPLENIFFMEHLSDPFYHRRRAVFSVENNKIGFKAYKSNDIINIDTCLLLNPQINEIIPLLRDIIPYFHLTEVIVSCLNGVVDVLLKSKIPLKMDNIIYLNDLCNHEKVARVHWQHKFMIEAVVLKYPFSLSYYNHDLKLTSGGFLQASNWGEEILHDLVIDNVQTAHNVLDLFSGLGGYSFAIMNKYPQVSICAVDNNSDAIKQINNLSIKNFKAIDKNLMKDPLTKQELSKYDTIIINPPRVGAKEQIKEISLHDSNQIVMIYCGLSALVRDIKFLLAKYIISNFTIVDQFVFSSQIEIVVSLRLK